MVGERSGRQRVVAVRSGEGGPAQARAKARGRTRARATKAGLWATFLLEHAGTQTSQHVRGAPGLLGSSGQGTHSGGRRGGQTPAQRVRMTGPARASRRSTSARTQWASCGPRRVSGLRSVGTGGTTGEQLLLPLKEPMGKHISNTLHKGSAWGRSRVGMGSHLMASFSQIEAVARHRSFSSSRWPSVRPTTEAGTEFDPLVPPWPHMSCGCARWARPASGPWGRLPL